jgi:hypothetical protein
MFNFEYVKLGSDVLLVAGIFFLAFRIITSNSIGVKTSQLLILEASLKGLIKDAEGSGRSLNEELSRRQNQLERLLGDLTSVENRLALQKQSIDQQIALQSQVNIKPTIIEPKINSEEIIPEAPSFATAVRQKPIAQRNMERTNNQIRKTAEDVKALARKIEVSRVGAQDTVLPELNSNRIETRDEELEAMNTFKEEENINVIKNDDSRLGVLSGMKRQVQTL